MIANSIFHCVNIPKADEWANVVKLDPWHVWLAETHDRKNCMTTDFKTPNSDKFRLRALLTQDCFCLTMFNSVNITSKSRNEHWVKSAARVMNCLKVLLNQGFIEQLSGFFQSILIGRQRPFLKRHLCLA